MNKIEIYNSMLYLHNSFTLLNFKWDGSLHILCFKLQALIVSFLFF